MGVGASGHGCLWAGAGAEGDRRAAPFPTTVHQAGLGMPPRSHCLPTCRDTRPSPPPCAPSPSPQLPALSPPTDESTNATGLTERYIRLALCTNIGDPPTPPAAPALPPPPPEADPTAQQYSEFPFHVKGSLNRLRSHEIMLSAAAPASQVPKPRHRCVRCEV